MRAALDDARRAADRPETPPRPRANDDSVASPAIVLPSRMGNSSEQLPSEARAAPRAAARSSQGRSFGVAQLTVAPAEVGLHSFVSQLQVSSALVEPVPTNIGGSTSKQADMGSILSVVDTGESGAASAGANSSPQLVSSGS